MKTVSRKDLAIGVTIRLTGERCAKVSDVRYAEGQLIVGGPSNKTATAERISFLDNDPILMHPGQLVGIV